MIDLKLDQFPTATVRNINSSTTVPCEIVTEGIAITPYLDLTLEEGYRLGGGFTLTHPPTGQTFVRGQACIECAHEVGRRLAALPVDWPSLDLADAEKAKTLIGDSYEAMIAALRLFGKCAQQTCFHDEQCGACGMERQHAPHCIYVVGPMVAEQNARILAKEASR